MIKPVLPYPGGKWKSRTAILSRLARYQNWTEFREPFVGSGAITIAMLIAQPRAIWVNDIDPRIYLFWKALRDHPDLLRKRIEDFIPSDDAFDQLKAYLRSVPSAACDHDIVHIGFCKLALHCLSYSGIGMNGGPKGGYGRNRMLQNWAPRYLSDNIANLRHYISHIRITNADYTTLLMDTSARALLFLDPPYCSTGAGLYTHPFARYEDHVALAEALRQTPHHWVMTYDKCSQIRQLYQDWADIEELPVKYTLRDRCLATELLILSRPASSSAG